MYSGGNKGYTRNNTYHVICCSYITLHLFVLFYVLEVNQSIRVWQVQILQN